MSTAAADGDTLEKSTINFREAQLMFKSFIEGMTMQSAIVSRCVTSRLALQAVFTRSEIPSGQSLTRQGKGQSKTGCWISDETSPAPCWQRMVVIIAARESGSDEVSRLSRLQWIGATAESARAILTSSTEMGERVQRAPAKSGSLRHRSVRPRQGTIDICSSA